MGKHSRDGHVAESVGVPSDENFRALVDMSPDAVYVIVDGFFVFANLRGLQLLGADHLAEIQAKPALDFMVWSGRDGVEDRLATMVARPLATEYVEDQVVKVDGTAVDVELAGRPISFGGYEAALLVARDITSRRQGEARLRAAEEKFRAAFQNAPSGMAIVSADGTFLEVNAAMGRLLDRRTSALRGTSVWDYVEPEDLVKVQRDFRKLVDDASTPITGMFRYRTFAGNDGWVHASLAALAGTQSYILHMIDVTQHKVTEETLHRKATHDLLTGLPNRGVVLHKLGVALRTLRAEPGEVHVLFIDLDGFKQVNDRHGHAVGDLVLRTAAHRMKGALRPSDLIGRIGGDEFVVIIKGLPDEAPGEEIAHRLAQAVAAPVALDEGIVNIRASIGHASTNDPDLPPARLLGSADADMYRVKQAVQRHEQKLAREAAQSGLRAVK
jgi:diguanylate cyclase (GGDEF)-like protein/PAS domain S-box-containing protein